MRNVSYVLGDSHDASAMGDEFDLAVAQFVFQHLSAPVGDTIHVSRWVRCGGKMAVIDIDGARLEHPATPMALQGLREAHATARQRIGGDRLAGRKLYHYLTAAGLADISVTMIPGLSVSRGPSPVARAK